MNESICSKCNGRLNFTDRDDIVSEPLICGYCVRNEVNPKLTAKTEVKK